MNIYLMVDLEGISGIYTYTQTRVTENRFDEGRRLMTQDINVCVEACKEAGAKKVYVRDCHSASHTLIYENLTDKADYCISGSIMGGRYHDVIKTCHAAILLGYHAMAGSKAAVLDHTFNSKTIQNCWVNGRLVGETAIDAAILGDYGVPVIMVSGDDKVCGEAKEFLPWVVTAEVKKGVDRLGAMLLPQKKAHEVIRQKTIEAIQKIDTMQPFVFSKPVTMRIEKMEGMPILNKKRFPSMKFIDGRTYEIQAENMEEALFQSM
ncbi:MAG: M55 family metallopeptidase [Firmicutes bacterium]|nr:M55 family metallopeptidase [Bacillota bacterium]